MAINDALGRFRTTYDQSEESENGPNGFPMPKNLGIDTKIKFLACSEQKLQRACCLKDKYSPGERRMYLKPKFDVRA